VSCAKTAELIEMPFGRLSFVGPRNHVLDGDQDRMNPFAATRGKKLFLPNCTLVIITRPHGSDS